MATHTKGPWKAHFNVPTAIIPGHIITADHGGEVPIALIWEGGGLNGKPTAILNAHLIAAAPSLLERVRTRFNTCWCHKRGSWCPECTQDFAAIELACGMAIAHESTEAQQLGTQVDAHA